MTCKESPRNTLLGKGWTMMKFLGTSGFALGPIGQTWQILAAPHSRTRSKRIDGETSGASHWHLIGIAYSDPIQSGNLLVIKILAQ